MSIGKAIRAGDGYAPSSPSPCSYLQISQTQLYAILSFSTIQGQGTLIDSRASRGQNMQEASSSSEPSDIPLEEPVALQRSPFARLLDSVSRECRRQGLWCAAMQRDLPKRWQKHGQLILLPDNCFTLPQWRRFGEGSFRNRVGPDSG